MTNSKLEENIAVIINSLKNIESQINDFKKAGESRQEQINNLRIEFSALKERTSNLAIFQSVFSAIIGAIALALSQLIK